MNRIPTAIRSLAASLALPALLLASSPRAHAFKPKTHIWVGQQVLNDVVPDGKVRIDGRDYPVPAAVVEALRKHPNDYRMGHVGPDAFPDIIVGQMTIHPGVHGGKDTDEWLKFIMDGARGNPRDLALSSGFFGHAAGDIFAHTYVNNYAGDIFDLMDGEQTVELRHIALEAFIERYTPPLVDERGRPLPAYEDAIDSRAEFVRDRLILSSGATHDFLKVPKAAPHLIAMRGLIAAADILLKNLGIFEINLKQAVDAQTALLIGLEKETREARHSLDVVKLQYEEAKLIFDAQTKLIDAQIAIIDASVDALGKLDAEMAKVEAKLKRITSDLADTADKLNRAKGEVLRLPTHVTEQVCRSVQEKVCGRLFKPLKKGCKTVTKTVCAPVRVVNKAYKDAVALEQSLTGTMISLTRQAANLGIELQSLQSRKIPYAVALAAAKAKKQELELYRAEKLKEPLDKAFAAYEKTRSQFEALYDKTVKLSGKITKLNQVLAVKLNPVKLIVQSWREDMLRAVLEYAKASQAVVVELLKADGRPMKPLSDWKDCWGTVFMGIPSAMAKAGCFATRAREELAGRISELHDSIIRDLGDLAWLVAPGSKLKELAYKEFSDDLERSALDVSGHVLGPEMTALIRMLRNGVTERDLDALFAHDKSGKGLLIVPDISQRAKRDMGVENGQPYFDLERFPALKNAVTLAKLTLLDAAALNQLVRDHESFLGNLGRKPSLFNEGAQSFNILYGAVRSIDGNHQWMQFAPPYLRRGAQDYRALDRPEYGRAAPGFLLWSDPKLRKRVFHEIFDAPLNAGLLDLMPADYPFAEEQVIRRR